VFPAALFSGRDKERLAMTPDLVFDNISKSFPGVRALQEVSFGIRRGSVHGLLGENGAGKSTMMKILGGQYRPDTGSIRIEGKTVAFDNARASIDAGVAIIHQELQLINELTVAENMMIGHFPARAGFIDKRAMFRAVEEHLGAIGIDTDPRAVVGSLSIGQRQMVEIAKALMLNAKVIALDEPTSSLSARETEILFRTIRDLQRDGRIIVYISHRLDEVFELCDSATVLRDGRKIITHEDLSGVTRGDLIHQMVGREIADIFRYQPRPAGGVRLDVKGLMGRGLAKPADFQVRAGEILGFFGLVGAGRSELMELLYGAEAPVAGEIRIDGQALPTGSIRSSIRNGLVFCPEDRKQDGIISARSVSENINISCRRHFRKFGLFVDDAREVETAERYVARLGIKTPHIRQDIVALSGGNQQKTILSRWLAESGVRVIIMDEPTRGIDVGAKSEIYSVIYDLAAQGCAVVVVSSELPEVRGICDRICVMREGVLVRDFERADASEAAVLQAALPTKD
jgi:L-arabinose transport system ATP-binding protein